MPIHASRYLRFCHASVHPGGWRSFIVVAGIVLGALVAPTASHAKPDLSQCTIQLTTPTPQEGDVVEYLIRVKNTGDEAANDVHLEVVSPMMGILIGATGPVIAELDEMPASARGSVDIPVGGETTIRVQVLAPRKSAGDVLNLSLRAAHYPSGIEQWEHHSVKIERRPAKSGIVLAGLMFHPASFWLLAWLFASLLVLGVLALLNRSPERTIAAFPASSTMRRMWHPLPIAPTMMLMIPVAFWMVFGGMAWHDFQVLTAWKQADATIVGRREVVKTSSSTSRTAGRTSTSTSTTYTPEFALRYEVEGKTIISNGFDTGTSVHVGERVIGEQEYAKWTVGTVVPCWYDPADPTDVVVRRGFGGAYLFALLPLPIFWFGIVVVRKMLRGR